MPARNVEYIISLRDRISRKLKVVERHTRSVDRSMLSLRSTVATVFTGFAAAAVIRDIIKVGSNFEQLQISFETMLGSAEKATQLIKDLTQFAIKTPFELKDVSKGAKSLLAFGIANEKIIPTLRSLGDVAAGLSVPIERLILNFGQVKTQGRLTGRELRDFAIAGVPLLNELAKVIFKTSETTDKMRASITSMVTKGDIGFKVVEQAFKNMSGEGGKFFNLMQKQTASTGGQISNLRDVVALLEDDLFKKFQPALNAGVQSLQNLIASLRTNVDTVINVLSVLKKLILIWISYKAILISVNLITKVLRLGMIALRIATVAFSRGLRSAIFLMKGFRTALATTGIGLLAIALGFFIDKLTTLSGKTSVQIRLQNKINKSFEVAATRTDRQTGKLQDLIILLNSKTKADFVQKRALQELQKLFPSYFNSLDIEKAKLVDIELLQKKIAEGNRLRALMLLRTAAQEKLEKFKTARTIPALRGSAAAERQSDAREKRLRQMRGIVAKLTKDARNVADNIARLEIQEKIDKIKAKIKTGEDISTEEQLAKDKSTGTIIRSAAPKTFNINIEQLVGEINNNVQNMTEGMAQSKEIVVQGLLAALNDTQSKVT